MFVLMTKTNPQSYVNQYIGSTYILINGILFKQFPRNNLPITYLQVSVKYLRTDLDLYVMGVMLSKYRVVSIVNLGYKMIKYEQAAVRVPTAANLQRCFPNLSINAFWAQRLA